MAGKINHLHPHALCTVCGDRFKYDKFVYDKFCSLRCAKESERLTLLKEAEAHWEAQGRDLRNLDWDRRMRIACIGDTHFPWASERACHKMYELLEEFKPTHIVQLGDLYDFFSQSKFPRPLIITPRDEAKMGREMAVHFWRRLIKTHKKAECWQIRGNHFDRSYKRQIEFCPDNEPFLEVDSMLKFDGVQTVFDTLQELILGNICFQHGHKKFGAHVTTNLMNTVHGHTHRGAVHYVNIRDKVIWELDAGYLADPASTPLKYRQQKWNAWTLGVGIINHLGPMFCPL